MRRFAPQFALPGLLLIAYLVAPLVSGRETLILRDVLQTHLLDRISLGEAARQLEVPLVDPLRAGGQPLAGNLNALPFYPDNLLLLVPAASAARATLWALNAHFWLHWLVAFAAMFWMARAFGLAAPAAWSAASVYALSGFFASQLNLFNTVAAAALAPALVAAVLETAPEKSPATRRRGLLACGLLWGLLLVGGEPLLALIAAAAACGALAWIAGRRGFSLRLALSGLAGTLLAAPQIVELARILPLSFRNNAAFGEPQAILGSFRTAHAADLLWPFFFGRPSLVESLAPQQFDGYPPLLFTLYPGLLALALAAAGARAAFPGAVAEAAAPHRRRAAVWGLGALAAALFFASGRFNPVVEALWSLPLGRLLRFPAKFWLLGALGGSLLAGIGFETAFGEGRRRLSWLLGLLAAFFAAFLGAAIAAPERIAGWLAGVLRPDLPAPELQAVLVRLQGLSVLSLGLLLLAFGLVRTGRRAPLVAGLGLLALHAATQGWAMLPGVPTDDATPYLEASPLLASIPAGSVVVHGGHHDLFRPGTIYQGDYPDGRFRWLARRAARELYPFTAVQHGLRAELAISPEGLDTFLTQALTVGLRNFSDRQRLQLLAALGVDYLLLDRELAPEALAAVREVAQAENYGQSVHLYELADRAREVELATRVVAAPHMNAALEAIFAPAFDPHTTAVVPGTAPIREDPAAGAGRRTELLTNGREEVIVDCEASAPGVLFLRRAYLPSWRATIDGVAAPTLVTQVARLGVAVPAGRHRVRLWVDRRPLAAGFGLALCGVALLLLVVRRPERVVPFAEPKPEPQ